jgi:hypothetical protein
MSTQVTHIGAIPPPEPAGRPNPFKGLAYFSEADRASFGGRERDIRTVSSGILKNRTFLLYGRSGLGKTSLLRAGVFPDLASHGCRPVYVRALVDPLQDLHTALVEQLGGDPAHDLHRLIDDADNEGPVAVVFDQFEEFFLRFPTERRSGGPVRREAFLKTLGALAETSDLNLRLVFSLREDWVASMKDLERFIPSLDEAGADASHRLLPLTAFGVRQAILQTLKAGGTAFDPRLISALVEELAAVQFDPAVLQVVGSEVWQQADQRTPAGEPVRMVLQDMEAVGGVTGIFQRYLRQVARALPAADRRVQIQTRAVLDALITEHGTKRAVPYTYFFDCGFEVEPAELDRVLNLLCQQRLVRQERRGEEDWFELIHERLIPTIRDWLEADEDFWRFRAAGNLVESSCSNLAWEDNPGLLLSREQLDHTIGPYKGLLRCTDEQKVFLLSSAIYCGSDDLEGWATLTGDEVTVALVERFLEDPENPAARVGAAQAAGRMTARRGHFADHCLRLAVEDPDRPVRQAAAHSFALLAGPDQLRTLASRLRLNAHWPRTSRVLAEVVDRGLPPEHPFAFWQVRYARWTLRRRTLDQAEFALRGRRARGALTGAIAGLLWSALPGTILLRIFLAELFPLLPTSGEITVLSAMGLSLLFTVPFGALAGWLVAGREAQEALFRDQEGRRGSSLCSWRMLWAILGPAVALLAIQFALGADGIAALPGGLGVDLSPFWALLALTLLVPTWGLLLLWLGLLEALLRPTLFRLAPRRRLVLVAWAWLWAVGGSLLLPLVVWNFVDVGRVLHWAGKSAGGWRMPLADWLEAIAFSGLNLLASLGGLLLFAAILAIARSSPAWGRGFPEDFRLGRKEPPRVGVVWHWGSLLGGILLTAGAVVGLHQMVSFDSLLLPLDTLYLEGDKPLEITPDFERGAFDTDWVALEVEGDNPRLVRLEGVPEALRVYQSEIGLVPPGQMLILPSGDVRLALQWEHGADRQTTAPLRLVPLAGAETSPFTLVVEDWRTAMVRLDYHEATRRWRGAFTGNTPGGPGDEGRALQLKVSPLVCDEDPAQRAAGSFQLTVEGQAEETSLYCAETLTLANFLEVPLPRPERRGEFTLDLELRSVGLTATDAEPVFLFLRLGWYAPEPKGGSTRALLDPEKPCAPTDLECVRALTEELTDVQQQIAWWQQDLQKLRRQHQRVLLEAVLDETSLLGLEDFLRAEGIDLARADAAALRKVEGEIAGRRRDLAGSIEKILALEGSDRGGRSRLIRRPLPSPQAPPPSTRALRDVQQLADPATLDFETLAGAVRDLQDQPAFQWKVALQRQTLEEQMDARRRQIEAEEKKAEALEGRLPTAPEGDEEATLETGSGS